MDQRINFSENGNVFMSTEKNEKEIKDNNDLLIKEIKTIV